MPKSPRDSREGRPVALLRPHGTHRCLEGHPWIFENEIASIRPEPAPGRAVLVRSADKRVVGSGLFSPSSQIRIRLFAGAAAEFDRALVLDRLRDALQRRPPTGSARLVWSEADFLPGLIVDRFDKAVTFQILHAGLEAHRGTLIQCIADLMQPSVLVERSDAASRALEGLPARNELVAGSSARVRFTLGALQCETDLLAGQKTGAYLDQSTNYQLVAARAAGRTVLDCFSNAGGFALHCAAAGATTVEAVESSAAAIAEGAANARLNGLNVTWHEANAFDWLRQAVRDGRTFDLIVLDPPSFTKSRHTADAALRGFREITVRALQMLRPGGLLATYCCSHHIDRVQFEQITREAASDTRRPLRLLERHSQASDHPILLAMPESEYLKGLLFEVARM